MISENVSGVRLVENNPIVKRHEYVNRRGEVVVQETFGVSYSKLGGNGSHCKKNEDPDFNCFECKNYC
jgi:hypothetical protein